MFLNRERPDALSRRGKDRIAQRGSDHRHFVTDAVVPLIGVDEMHAELFWKVAHGRHAVGIEIALPDLAVSDDDVLPHCRTEIPWNLTMDFAHHDKRIDRRVTDIHRDVGPIQR